MEQAMQEYRVWSIEYRESQGSKGALFEHTRTGGHEGRGIQ